MAVLEQVVDALGALDLESVDRQDRAVVHGDFHPANLILRDGQVTAVCDFDFVQQAPRAYDLAYSLYRTAGISSRGGGSPVWLDSEVSQAFLDGYHDI